MSALSGNRLMNGSMSASRTDLPKIRAATAIEIDEYGETPVPSSINTRTNMTRCSATKKKIVGGRILKNSSFSLVISGVFLSASDGNRQQEKLIADGFHGVGIGEGTNHGL